MIEAWSTGQRIRGRRRGEHRPTLIVCDDLQNDSHISSAMQRESSRSWFHGTLLKAGTKRTNVVNLATALHRDALALELHAAAGWISKRFAAIETWPANMELWEEWEAIYCDADDPGRGESPRVFRRSPNGDGGRRRRAMARGGRPLHADADAGRERPHGLRARKARFADQPRVVRVAGIVFRRFDLVRRVAGGAGDQDDCARSEQRAATPAAAITRRT